MTADPADAGVELLQSFGLSAYAARTFVALVRLDEATAREVSDAADVPRTRVYDAVDELVEQGLVDVQHASPKRFWAVSAETASRTFGKRYRQQVRALQDSLETLEADDEPTEQRGVWTVTGREKVTDRLVEFLDGADEEVVFMTVEALLEDRVLAALRAASERGVTVRFAEMAGEVERDLAAAVPAGDPFESLWDWSATPAGRLLLVDRTQTLVSVLGHGGATEPPLDETAIWGSGETNGLVVVLQVLFAWQLERD